MLLEFLIEIFSSVGKLSAFDGFLCRDSFFVSLVN